ncbi:class I SAM-dependent methyltransferase [Kribbella solani]|uniref:class I SAM-dependent methyltransferase n=1 Tax=Kribbella solani TaxID=236067 RepID=UPI0029A5C4F0|nr:class I SAM-dependent methyltransferase [Kribbella solani]MDX2973057.1 class I SAM-dependent methyltransferase [Kribbella solani]
MSEWTWDESLYAGSAAHYPVGRMAYPEALGVGLRDELGLDGQGRLLDVGCGPGSLTLLLAPYFATVVGVDADADMLAVAAGRASDAGIGNAEWHQSRAEELPGELGAFQIVTFAQSFHWMDQPLVAARIRGMLAPGGRWVQVRATTHRGLDGPDELPRPRPPWDAIDALVARYLGPVRRAGQGVRLNGALPDEEEIMKAAGYEGPDRLIVGGDEIEDRTVEQLIASVFSLSSSAPHLFGTRLPDFEAELRELLTSTADHGRFAERRREIETVIWH